MPNDTELGLTTRRVPVDTLHIDPANARKHGDENLDAIAASLKRFGQAEPLVVQKNTGRVVGGNGRLAVMRKLGWTEATVVELDLDDLTATALGIALNRTSELAEWNDSTLARLLEELRAEGVLDGVGYSESDLDALLDEIQGDIDANSELMEDEVPEPPEEATTRPGDLWILGNHRLLCGDSSEVEDVDRLLGGESIHLVNTDPPYNVKVEPRSNNAIAGGLSSFNLAKSKRTSKKLRAKDRPLQNDFVSDEEFERLLDAWFGNMARALLPGRGFYIWGGYANIANYPRPLAENGLYFSQAIVWDKQHPVLTRKDFMGAHEWCFYGWKEGAAHKFLGPANATDLWSIKKVNPQSMIHLTEKPVELAARAIQYSSRKGEKVLDLFGGSGSTLIAAEQTGRKAFLMDIDELYSDVIIERWQKLTGGNAVLDSDGRAFEEVRGERTCSGEGKPCSTG